MNSYFHIKYSVRHSLPVPESVQVENMGNEDQNQDSNSYVATTREVRTLVVMDAENLVISCSKELGKGTDIRTLDEWIHQKHRVIEKMAFIDISRVNGYRHALHVLGWTFRNVLTKVRDEDTGIDVRIKNAIDIELALETYEYATRNPLDKVLLISGDGDYLPLVKRIKKIGIGVDVLAVKACMSRKLLKFADRYYSYESVLSGLEDGVSEYGEGDDMRIKRRRFFQAAREVLNERIKPYDSMSAAEFKPVLKESIPGFDEQKLGFPRFKNFLIAGEEEGFFELKISHPAIYVSLGCAKDICREEETGKEGVA